MAQPKGKDLKIDPLTGDYTLDSANGALEITSNSDSAVYHQIRGRLGEWFADFEAGSQVHTLLLMKSSLRTLPVIRDIFEVALQPLVEDGRIEPPQFEQARDPNTFLIETQVTVKDLQTGQVIDVTTLLPMDNP